MPELLAPALEQLARLLELAGEQVGRTRSRLHSQRDAEIIACLQRADGRITQGCAILGARPARVESESLVDVVSSTVRLADPQEGASAVTLHGMSHAPTPPITEWQRIAVAALVAAALSNSQRHRPGLRCDVSIARDPHPQVVIVSGSPLGDSPPPGRWAGLMASDLGPLAGTGLTLSAALARRAGLEIRALHGPERTALAVEVADQTPPGVPSIGTIDTLQQRLTGARAVLSEHGALSLLADVMPLLAGAPRRTLASAMATLREADALAAEAEAYTPMQPAR